MKLCDHSTCLPMSCTCHSLPRASPTAHLRAREPWRRAVLMIHNNTVRDVQFVIHIPVFVTHCSGIIFWYVTLLQVSHLSQLFLEVLPERFRRLGSLCDAQCKCSASKYILCDSKFLIQKIPYMHTMLPFDAGRTTVFRKTKEFSTRRTFPSFDQ